MRRMSLIRINGRLMDLEDVVEQKLNEIKHMQGANGIADELDTEGLVLTELELNEWLHELCVESVKA